MRYPEYLFGSSGMNVHAIPECLYKMLVLTEMSHDPQFYLGIVSRYDEAVCRTCHEGFSDFLSTLRPDRDILEVRVR